MYFMINSCRILIRSQLPRRWLCRTEQFSVAPQDSYREWSDHPRVFHHRT